MGTGLDLDPTADYVARNAVLNAQASWPGRLIVQRDDLSTFIPFSGNGHPLPDAYQIFRPRRRTNDLLVLWRYPYKVNNGVPIDAATALTQSVIHPDLSYAEKYIEIYQIDVKICPALPLTHTIR